MGTTIDSILEKPFKLNKSQENAIVSDAKYIRILAGAGAGKTETLARKIIYYLLVKGAEPDSIVSFTFTEMAAESMKSRIHQRLVELGQQELLKKFGQIYIGTIHGYALRILQDHYGYSNYSVLDENQHMAFIIREGYNIGLNKEEHRDIGSYLERCKIFISSLSAFYGELVDRNSFSEKDAHFKIMLERYEDKLKENHRLTFDKLISEAVSKLRESNKGIEKSKYIVVDEFQDINKAQYEMIRLMSKEANLIIVGDPRQSIYQWRGGNPRFFDDFIIDFKNTSTFEINENRRSVKEIVLTSNTISASFNGTKFPDMIPYREEHGVVTKLDFKNAEEEASEIAKEIKRLVHEHGFSYSDFSILLRSVRTSADPFIDAFKSNKIPYIVGGKVGLFKRDEAVALGMLITWLDERGYWLINTYGNNKISGNNLRDEGIKRWKASITYSLSTERMKTELDAWKRKVLTSSPSDEYGYKDVLHDLLNILGFQKLDQNNDLDAVVMSTIGAFSKILGDFESSFRLGGQKREFYQELHDLCNFLNGFAIISYDEQPVEKTSNANALSIMTIHQSKGLEWPIVFMPAMVNGRFPTRKKAQPDDIWMFDPALIANKSYFDSEEGEKRLFYVASTRAMTALVYSHFRNHKVQKAKPSSLLDKVNEKYIEHESFSQVGLDKLTIHKNSNSYTVESYPVKELIDYEMCPYHYRLSKIWGYIQGVNTFMGYGDELHHILKVTSDLVKMRGLSPMEALKESTNEFFLPFASKGLREKLRVSATKELSKFVKDHEKDIENIEETELRIEFPAKKASIIGKVDTIFQSSTGLEIRDYKSSDSVMKKEYSEMQVQLYAKGLKDMGWEIVNGSVANLKDNSIEFIDVSDGQINKSLSKAEAIIDNIQNYRYHPRPGEFCEQCEYRKICAHKVKK